MSNKEAISLLRNLEESLDSYYGLNDVGKAAFSLAIEALNKMETLNSSDDLPSAQPEIIRCKDCQYWREGSAYSYCDKLCGMGVLDVYDYMTAGDDYCSMAKRK